MNLWDSLSQRALWAHSKWSLIAYWMLKEFQFMGNVQENGIELDDQSWSCWMMKYVWWAKELNFDSSFFLIALLSNDVMATIQPNKSIDIPQLIYCATYFTVINSSPNLLPPTYTRSNWYWLINTSIYLGRRRIQVYLEEVHTVRRRRHKFIRTTPNVIKPNSLVLWGSSSVIRSSVPLILVTETNVNKRRLTEGSAWIEEVK